MNIFMMRFVSGHDGDDDQPLTKAARVALEANPTPRIIKMIVDHDGMPIEIPAVAPPPVAEPTPL